MLNKLILSTILILSSCTIAIADGIDNQDGNALINQYEESFVSAPEMMDEQNDSILDSPSVEASALAPRMIDDHDDSQREESPAVAPEVLSSPIIQDTIPTFYAIILCDNPLADFQEQLKQSGARVLKVGSSTFGEGDEAALMTTVEVEVSDYESLNKIGQLNFVMRVDGVMELLGIADDGLAGTERESGE